MHSRTPATPSQRRVITASGSPVIHASPASKRRSIANIYWTTDQPTSEQLSSSPSKYSTPRNRNRSSSIDNTPASSAAKKYDESKHMVPPGAPGFDDLPLLYCAGPEIEYPGSPTPNNNQYKHAQIDVPDLEEEQEGKDRYEDLINEVKHLRNANSELEDRVTKLEELVSALTETQTKKKLI